jgi:hypothetical protein
VEFGLLLINGRGDGMDNGLAKEGR